MAVSFKPEHTRGSEYNFFPEQIKTNPSLNGRHDLPNIDWLVASILERGQDTPVIIRKDGDMPVLTSGYSRFRAVSHINKHKLAPVKMRLRCVFRQEDERGGYLGNIAENHFRNQTTQLDDAYNIKTLINRYNMTEEEVSDFYFPTAKTKEEKKDSLKWVRDRAGLACLSPEAETALKEGRLKLPAAKAIAKLSEEQQRAAVKGNGQIKTRDIREASGKPKPPSLREALKGVVDSGKFQGIGGKQVEASDDMLEFLALLIWPAKGKKKGDAA
jgi:ParB-like chromosome segregation protein Spo0J